MAVSRRIFLRQGVLAAAACATTPLLAFSSKRPVGGDDQTRDVPSHHSSSSSGSGTWQDHAAALDHLGREQFTEAIGTNFKVTVEGSSLPVWVTLMAVDDLPALAPVNPASFAVPGKQSSSALATTGFMLRFSSSAQLPQGTYLFQHDGLGPFALLIVPAGNQQVYNATINRLAGATIIAVPFSKSPARFSGQASAPAAAIVPAAPATSSGTGNLPRGLSESPAAQRAVVRD